MSPDPGPLTVDPERLFAKIGLLTVQVELLQEQLAALTEADKGEPT